MCFFFFFFRIRHVVRINKYVSRPRKFASYLWVLEHRQCTITEYRCGVLFTPGLTCKAMYSGYGSQIAKKYIVSVNTRQAVANTIEYKTWAECTTAWNSHQSKQRLKKKKIDLCHSRVKSAKNGNMIWYSQRHFVSYSMSHSSGSHSIKIFGYQNWEDRNSDSEKNKTKNTNLNRGRWTKPIR